MVFPRNAGLGRCYLVSTRHEILSNIDRNLTGTQLQLRKNRNKINPARVRIPSQFYCCPAFLPYPKKVYEVHNKKSSTSTIHANIGAKSKIFQLRIFCEGQWRKQNQAIHRCYLYFKSHTIHIQDI